MKRDDHAGSRPRARFDLGRLVATANAHSCLTPDDILSALGRHVRGDWGNLDAEDKVANERALVGGSRILSKYRSVGGIDFYVITEWDRSLTTVLLPEDY